MVFPEKDTNELYGDLFILMDSPTGIKNSTNQTSSDGQLLHRPPLRNGHVSVAEDMHHSHRLTSATVLLSPWWPLWKDLAVDAIFAIIISTRDV